MRKSFALSFSPRSISAETSMSNEQAQFAAKRGGTAPLPSSIASLSTNGVCALPLRPSLRPSPERPSLVPRSYRTASVAALITFTPFWMCFDASFIPANQPPPPLAAPSPPSSIAFAVALASFFASFFRCRCSLRIDLNTPSFITASILFEVASAKPFPVRLSRYVFFTSVISLCTPSSFKRRESIAGGVPTCSSTENCDWLAPTALRDCSATQLFTCTSTLPK